MIKITYELDYDVENPPKFLDTKFGRARINHNGYYQITSHKEGNWHKLLHRLLFEEYYQISIENEFPNQKMAVHHIDENKINNNIWNLDIMTISEHRKLHMTPDKHPFIGKHHSLEARQKISKVHLGKIMSEESKQLMSKSKNTSGFYRVCKQNDPTCTQGFVWSYKYYPNSTKRRIITRTNLIDLMEKVTSENLPWLIIDEHNAKQTSEQYGYDYNILKMEVN